MSKIKITLTGKGNSNKEKWPFEAKVKAVALKLNSGKTAKEAIQEVADDYDLELKPSYEKHAGSHIWRFCREVEKKVEKDDAEAIRLVREYLPDLVEDDEEDNENVVADMQEEDQHEEQNEDEEMTEEV